MADQEKPAPAKNRIGFLKGKYTIPDNWDEINKEMDKEIEELFYGSEIEPAIEDADESDRDS
jgi:hypothetical protein